MRKLKLRRPSLLAIAATAAFMVGACAPPEGPNTAKAPTAATPSPTAATEVANLGEAAVQKLIGKWDGVEGTYLTVTEKMGTDGKQQLPRKFEVEIKDLDRAEKFEGTAKNGVIEFTRKGKTETVKAATGAETGMKYLEKETDCIVVAKGSEGFCKKAGTPAAPATPMTSPEKVPAASPKK